MLILSHLKFHFLAKATACTNYRRNKEDTLKRFHPIVTKQKVLFSCPSLAAKVPHIGFAVYLRNLGLCHILLPRKWMQFNMAKRKSKNVKHNIWKEEKNILHTHVVNSLTVTCKFCVRRARKWQQKIQPTKREHCLCNFIHFDDLSVTHVGDLNPP